LAGEIESITLQLANCDESGLDVDRL